MDMMEKNGKLEKKVKDYDDMMGDVSKKQS
jgi:hypothetical protein